MKHLPKRKNSLRYPGYDYASEGAYFVTICTYKRLHYFGTIKDGITLLSPLGEIALARWLDIPQHFETVRLAGYVVMPNHVHGIVLFDNAQETYRLGQVIGTYKAAVSRQAKQSTLDIDLDYPVWQRGYHDHIIRDQRGYDTIKHYINTNPEQWEQDTYYE